MTPDEINEQAAPDFRKLAEEAVIVMCDLRRRLEQNYEPDTCFSWAEKIEERAIKIGLVKLDAIGNVVPLEEKT